MFVRAKLEPRGHGRHHILTLPLRHMAGCRLSTSYSGSREFACTRRRSRSVRKSSPPGQVAARFKRPSWRRRSPALLPLGLGVFLQGVQWRCSSRWSCFRPGLFPSFSDRPPSSAGGNAPDLDHLAELHSVLLRDTPRRSSSSASASSVSSSSAFSSF